MGAAYSNDVLPGWPASNVFDGSNSTDYSSNLFSSARNSRGAFLAVWVTNGPVNANQVILTSRQLNGVVQAFPVSYDIQVTTPSNSAWMDLGDFTAQPGPGGQVAVQLPTTYSTYGVLIIPNTLGADAYGNHYFQMAEVSLGYQAQASAGASAFNGSTSTPINIGGVGCNAINVYQLPGSPSLFLSRHLNNTTSDPCSGSTWYLSLSSMDWTTGTLSEIGSIFTPGQAIMNGAYTIVSAYDATAIDLDGTLWIAFECVDGAGHVDSCVGPLLPSYQLDVSHTSVAIQGVNGGGYSYSASVPKLLSFQGNVYLYWTVVQALQGTSHFVQLTVRGAQLGFDPAGSGRLFAAGRSVAIGTTDASTVEVFGINPSDPESNSTADGYQAVSIGNFIYFMSAQGGSGCTTPTASTTGCYRFGISRTQTPLAYHAFNGQTLNQALLPGNPSQYAHIVQPPGGGYGILVYLLGGGAQTAQALSPGMVLLPIPNDPFFQDASFISQSVPGSMAPGQSYPVSLTFENAGLIPWSQAQGYRLGAQAPNDNSTWGPGRADLSTGQVVPPGAQATFSFTVTAPTTPGSYTFQWGMLQEGVAWFGQSSPSTLVNISDFSAFSPGTVFAENVSTPIGAPSLGLNLIQQSDGNLVLYRNSTPLWQSYTGGQNCGAGCVAVFDGTGNLVVWQGSTSIWESGTHGVELVISDIAPYVTIWGQSGNLLWQGGQSASDVTTSSWFPPGTVFTQNVPVQIGIGSQGLSMVMQGDGNLVLYQKGTPLWYSGTGGLNCGANQCIAIFQGDGNFVIYNAGSPIWASGGGGTSLLLGPVAPYISLWNASGLVWSGNEPPALQ